MAALYCLISVVGCVGNAFVIFMFANRKSLRTPANILVMNLAICDFLMLIKCPIAIYNNIKEGPALGDIGKLKTWGNNLLNIYINEIHSACIYVKNRSTKAIYIINKIKLAQNAWTDFSCFLQKFICGILFSRKQLIEFKWNNKSSICSLHILIHEKHIPKCNGY